MKIIKLKKDLIKVKCLTCEKETYIFKYSKKKIFCDLCTSTLAIPKGNKAKILHNPT